MKITGELLRMLRPEIDAAMKDIEIRHGIKIATGRGSYDTEGAFGSFKLEIAALDAQGAAKSEAAEDFRLYADAFGLSPDALGATFTVSGKTHTITGLRRRAAKKPILTKTADGRTYIWSADLVRRLVKLPVKEQAT